MTFISHLVEKEIGEKDVIKILSIHFYQNSLPLIGKLTDFLSDSLSFLVVK